DVHTDERAGKTGPVGPDRRVDHERLTKTLRRPADAEVPGRCVESARAFDRASAETRAADGELRAARVELYLTAFRVGLNEPSATRVDIGPGGRRSGQSDEEKHTDRHRTCGYRADHRQCVGDRKSDSMSARRLPPPPDGAPTSAWVPSGRATASPGIGVRATSDPPGAKRSTRILSARLPAAASTSVRSSAASSAARSKYGLSYPRYCHRPSE